MWQAEPKILWTEVTRFIGQLNHDLRNHLNAVELQAAFLSEVVEQPEAKEEIKRLRGMTGEMGAHLQKLSGLLAKVKLTTMSYRAAEFVEDLRAKFALDQPEQSAAITWNILLEAETLEIDPQLLQEAFLELFQNAFAHERGEGSIAFEARREGETVQFTLREPKASFDDTPENWGTRPLGRMGRGHYGLGLFRARSIFEEHHGTLRSQFDPAAATLITTVSLPCASNCGGGL